MSNLVSTSLSHIPFLNSCDASRLQMVSKYFGGQSLPHLNNELPKLVSIDSYKTAIYSDRFIKFAKDDGLVVYSNDDFMVVYYENLDKIETYDLGLYKHISSKFATKLRYRRKTNEKFKKGQLLFEYAGFINGIPAPGINTKIAFMPLYGTNYEDAILISESYAKRFKYYSYEEIEVPIYYDSVLKKNAHGKLLPEIGEIYELNEAVVTIGTVNEEDNFINYFININNTSNMNDDKNELDLIQAKVVDIKVYPYYKSKKYVNDYHTAEILKPYVEELENKKQNVKKELLKYIHDEKLVRRLVERIYGINKSKTKSIRNLKEVVYLLKIKLVCEEEFWPGDKVSSRGANKGVVKIIPDELMPKDEDGKPIDMVISPFAIPSRMNTNQIYEMYLSKFVVHIEKELLSGNISKAFQMILDVQEKFGKQICSTVKKYIEKLNNNDLLLKKFIDDVKKNGLYIIVDSFKDKTVTKKDIIELFNKYDIPLMSKIKSKPKELVKYLTGIERSYLPDEIEQEVFVGYMYIYRLFKISRYILNARSVGPYHSILKIPTRGRSKQGGSRIGNNEMDMLLSYDSKYVLKEFITIKADDHEHKIDYLNSVIQGQEYSIENIKSKSYVVLTVNSLAKTLFVDLEETLLSKTEEKTNDQL